MGDSQNEAETLQTPNPSPSFTYLSTGVSSDSTTIGSHGAMYLNNPPPPLPPGTVPNAQNPVCYEPQPQPQHGASATAYHDPIDAAAMDNSRNEAEAQQNPNPSFTYLSTGVSSDSTHSTTIGPHGTVYLNNPPPPLPPGTVPNTQNLVCYEPQPQHGVSATAYHDPIVAAYYQNLNENFLAAITQSGGISYATGAATTVPSIQVQKKITKQKAQSSWCDVCKIRCNSKEILDLHKLGKKHQRNCVKLKPQYSDVPSPVPAPLPVPTSAPTNEPLIGPEEKPKLPIPQKAPEDLETKKKKVLAGGAPPETVRLCHLCNVVCNSDTVFGHHLTGQKHLSMVKRLAQSEEGSTAED